MSSDLSVGMPADLGVEDAQALVGKISAGLDELRDAVVRLWQGRGWLALGYHSWEDLCAAEFPLRLQLPQQERRELVSELTGAGLSQRAVAPVVGVSQPQVVRDLQAIPDVSPGQTIGLDGKRYTRPAPQPLSPARQAIRDDSARHSAIYRAQHALMSSQVDVLINDVHLVADDDYTAIGELDIHAATVDRLRQLRDACDAAMTALTTVKSLRRVR